jgi:peptidyl-prolyl cis-trans isomerase A (cyclophilin A)
MKTLFALGTLLLLAVASGCNGGGNTSLMKDPAVPTADQTAASKSDAPTGETYYALFNTSKGEFIVAVHPGWAPHGAARFKELVEAGFYNQCRFFRVLDGFMAQIGMNGDPAVNSKWQDNVIPDDPVVESNTRGHVTFATSGANSRTSQIFFNYGDNGALDRQGFSPFGDVIVGMEVLDSLYSKYGEGAPGGSGPGQDQIAARGNEYLNAQFPNLDYIKTVQLFDTEVAAKAAMTAAAASDPAAAAEPAPATDVPAGDAPAADTPAAETPATEGAAESANP